MVLPPALISISHWRALDGHSAISRLHRLPLLLGPFHLCQLLFLLPRVSEY